MTDVHRAKFTVTRADGGSAAPDGPRPQLSEVELEGPDGARLLASLPQDGRIVPARYVVIHEAGTFVFDTCPICASPSALSREHVPPQALGGAVITATCVACNNNFGSKYEDELRRFWEYEFGQFSITHPTIRGSRNLRRVLIRTTPEGEPVILFSPPRDVDLGKAFSSGESLTVTYSPPDHLLWRWAALKSAYLGACVLLQQVIATEESSRVRELLVMARDAVKNQTPELDLRFSVARIDRPAVPGVMQP